MFRDSDFAGFRYVLALLMHGAGAGAEGGGRALARTGSVSALEADARLTALFLLQWRE